MTSASQSTTALNREEALAILADHQEEFRQLGVKSLALFGSVARNEARPDSDVDLLIETDFDKLPPWGFADIRLRLRDLLKHEVDLANPNLLKPRIRDQILQEAIPILSTDPAKQPQYQEFQPVPRKNWKVYIDDMIKAATKAQQYVQGSTYEQFLADERTIDAVLHNLTILGEAVSPQKLPRDIQDRYPQVPWSKINEVRNIVVHQYDDVDLAIIWKILQEGLPELLPELESLLASEERSEQSPQQLWQRYSQGLPTPIEGKQLTAIARRALQDNIETAVIQQMLLEAPYLKGLQERQGLEKAQEFARLAVRNATLQIQQSQGFLQQDQNQDLGPEL